MDEWTVACSVEGAVMAYDAPVDRYVCPVCGGFVDAEELARLGRTRGPSSGPSSGPWPGP